MQRLRRTMAAGFLAFGAAIASSSCVDNESSLFIYGVMEITNTQCLAKPDQSAVFISLSAAAATNSARKPRASPSRART